MPPGAKVLDSKTVACLVALKEALSTHQIIRENVDQENINVVDETINNKVDLRYLTFFITITNRCLGVGRWCLHHNHVVDDLILDEDLPALIAHVKRGRQNCIEIFDNPDLSQEEVLVVRKELEREYKAVQSAINNYNGTDAIVPTLVRNCYQTICFTEEGSDRPFSMERKIAVFDNPPGDKTPIMCCFDVVELVGLVADNVSINKCTKRPFGPKVREYVEERFSKELAMTRRYHRWLDEE